MLKIFRDGVAVETSKINCVMVEKFFDPETPFVVRAYFSNDDVILEWFLAEEDAEKYVEKIVAEINQL